jgi:hypothetical protein
MVEVLGILAALLLGVVVVLAVVEIVFIMYSGNAVIFRLGPLVGKSIFEVEEAKLNDLGGVWLVLGDLENIRCGRVTSQMLLVRLFAYKKSELEAKWTVECRGPMFLWFLYPVFMLFGFLAYLNNAELENLYAVLGIIVFIVIYQIQIKMQVVNKLKKLSLSNA